MLLFLLLLFVIRMCCANSVADRCNSAIVVIVNCSSYGPWHFYRYRYRQLLLLSVVLLIVIALAYMSLSWSLSLSLSVLAIRVKVGHFYVANGEI